MKPETVVPFLNFFTDTVIPVKFWIENGDVVIVEAPTGPLAIGKGHELVILPAGGMYAREESTPVVDSSKSEKISKKGT